MFSAALVAPNPSPNAMSLRPRLARTLRAALPAGVLLAATAALPLAAQSPAPVASAEKADPIVTTARIYTVDEARPTGEALAVRGGRVQFVGDARGALALRGPATRVVDAAGATLIPGMTDAHGHVLGLGQALRQVDLVGTRSYDEV